MEPAAGKPAPLAEAELARVWRWERWMIRYYAMAMTVIAGAVALALVYGESVFVRRAVMGLVLMLVLLATFVQFREKCPRCGARLGRQSRLILPDRCRSCGVAFPRPPKLDSELDN